MDKQQLIDRITQIVNQYRADAPEMKADIQLRINPLNLSVTAVTAEEMQRDLIYTNEAIDAETAAEGDATEAADDYEEAQDPDFYPLRTLTTDAAIEAVAAQYFEK